MTSNATNMAVAITARGLKDYEKEVVGTWRFISLVATFRIKANVFFIPKTEWSKERVAAFVEQECGLPMYKKLFMEHHVTGKIVGLITKQDLIDMGITKIGHQIRLLQKFKPFQAAQSAHKRLEGVRSWTEFVWPWHCFRFCYPRKFKLTQSGLRIRQDFWCGTWCSSAKRENITFT